MLGVKLLILMRHGTKAQLRMLCLLQRLEAASSAVHCKLLAKPKFKKKNHTNNKTINPVLWTALQALLKNDRIAEKKGCWYFRYWNPFSKHNLIVQLSICIIPLNLRSLFWYREAVSNLIHREQNYSKVHRPQISRQSQESSQGISQLSSWPITSPIFVPLRTNKF